MAHRTRHRSPGVSWPFVLALAGAGIVVVGLLVWAAAFYLSGSAVPLLDALGRAGGASDFLSIPHRTLFEGAFLTIAIGGLLVILGSLGTASGR